jgi:hypothetical protein
MKSMILVKPYSEYLLRWSLSWDFIGICSYAVCELQKDVERELLTLPESERDAKRTKFAVFVVHNKVKPKTKELPEGIPVCGRA